MSVQLKTELINELDEPKHYIVYMLNDDYTSWDFCLRIISTVFHNIFVASIRMLPHSALAITSLF